MTRKIPTAAVALAVLTALAAVYYFVDPAHTVWMPKCPFRLLTGLDCPACGTQRALYALLHGAWSEALACNPFALISLPYLALVILTTLRTPGERSALRYVQHPRTVRLYLLLIVGWWILRNTPQWQ
ncbi:DUF2752 domain-containing protein [uncultured Alistipes sp.]|uniref:DUF2752 domain-containing protein n=1 Tax=uncultured Alistipes sp. TaxID=538949 RepID=UPI0026702A43|nr:DUF2752 domain-containing protein [uncultured Alistipes sp.]